MTHCVKLNCRAHSSVETDAASQPVRGSLIETTTSQESLMTVRAKMYLESITHRAYGTEVQFRVVSRGADNKAWSAATPSGDLKLSIKNEKAAGQFTYDQLGTEFYIDINPVPAEQQGKEGME